MMYTNLLECNSIEHTVVFTYVFACVVAFCFVVNTSTAAV